MFSSTTGSRVGSGTASVHLAAGERLVEGGADGAGWAGPAVGGQATVVVGDQDHVAVAAAAEALL